MLEIEPTHAGSYTHDVPHICQFAGFIVYVLDCHFRIAACLLDIEALLAQALNHPRVVRMLLHPDSALRDRLRARIHSRFRTRRSERGSLRLSRTAIGGRMIRRYGRAMIPARRAAVTRYAVRPLGRC